jgi:hypothetical protein
VTLRLLAASEREALKAAQWYDKQEPGLGDEFLEELGQALSSIADHPGTFWRVETPRSKREVRCCLLQRFPYAVYFEIREQETLVLAIAHTARRPFYRKRRK